MNLFQPSQISTNDYNNSTMESSTEKDVTADILTTDGRVDDRITVQALSSTESIKTSTTDDSAKAGIIEILKTDS